jgi:hypothetical protein
MTADRALRMSERWFRLLLYLYPVDFRDVIGDGIVAAYRDPPEDQVPAIFAEAKVYYLLGFVPQDPKSLPRPIPFR